MYHDCLHFFSPGIGATAGGFTAAAAIEQVVLEQVVLETKYAGYVERQAAQVERFQRLESKPIPAHFDYQAVPQLRAEAKEKLSRIRPASLGQASRISGICPADLAVLLFYLGAPAAGSRADVPESADE